MVRFPHILLLQIHPHLLLTLPLFPRPMLLQQASSTVQPPTTSADSAEPKTLQIESLQSTLDKHCSPPGSSQKHASAQILFNPYSHPNDIVTKFSISMASGINPDHQPYGPREPFNKVHMPNGTVELVIAIVRRAIHTGKEGNHLLAEL